MKRKSIISPTSLGAGAAVAVVALASGSTETQTLTAQPTAVVKSVNNIDSPITVRNCKVAAKAAKQAGWTGEDLVTAVAVAMAESSCKADNVNKKLNRNGTRDYGLFQINSVHADLLATGNWRDPNQNARMARKVYQRQTWSAWSSVNSGAYRKYMPMARRVVGGLS